MRNELLKLNEGPISLNSQNYLERPGGKKDIFSPVELTTVLSISLSLSLKDGKLEKRVRNKKGWRRDATRALSPRSLARL